MTKRSYDGDLKQLESDFVVLLDHYTRRVFSEKLVTKKLYTRELSPVDLFRYIQAYAEVFKEGRMPKALSLVEAIGATTNLCAKDEAMQE